MLKSVVKKLLTKEQIDRLKDRRADAQIRRVISKQRSDKAVIRVGFIVQMAEIWDKESPVYDAMAAEEEFEAELIVVPPYDQITNTVGTTYEENYFLDKYPDAIRAYQDGTWIDLKDREYDYIFFQRPYDHYLPRGLRSDDIVKFAKVCYIPYGYTGSDAFCSGSTNKAFFRNVYFAFMESEHMAEVAKRNYAHSKRKGLHRILGVGYPALESFFDFPESTSIHNVLWTPRWSFDPVIGGSNFLNYKDAFIELAQSYPDIHFTFRPHPLMWGEIQKEGLMSQEEVDEYKGRLRNCGIKHDQNTPINNALRKTDVLITDYSSLIIEYFLTGRPIIYCESTLEANEEFMMMKNDMYVVESESELKDNFGALIAGIDPAKKCRKDLIATEFNMHRDAVPRIVRAIKEDTEE